MTAPNQIHARPVRVGVISLGCAKNLVDAEIMLGSLLQEGIEITNDPALADAVIVNTCSFIDAAQEESVDTILESAAVRDARQRGQALIVAGCLPQRFREELPALLPEVDAFMGIDQVAQVGRILRQALARRADRIARAAARGRKAAPAEAVRRARQDGVQPPAAETGSRRRSRAPASSAGTTGSTPEPRGSDLAPGLEVHARPTYIPDYATPRYRLTPRHFAYVKIAEGCNHPCSFCIIPRIRGSHRSRPPSDLVEEARRLLADGVKELNLISQDTTYYGLDLRPNRRGALASPETSRAAARVLPAPAATLSTLLRELNDLPGEFWIRLLYTHPAHWTDALIRTIAECPKVARYVDLPLQHIHPNMLERMRRETTPQYIGDLLRRIRAGLPGIALRTTFIVGFPGETDACFTTLLEFIREIRFERLGVFVYSQETGTLAGRMAHQVPLPIKRKRRDLAMAVQRAISRQIAAACVGGTRKVLVEGPAAPPDLDRATEFSWEHGLVRDTAAPSAPPAARRYQVARGEADAPDIDGRVYVRGRLPPGEFADVRILGHTDYDLIAEPL